jgi:dolichol kinase
LTGASDLRQVVHAATGLVALGTGFLPRWANVAGAVAGVVVGFVVLPMLPLEKRLRRPGEPFLCGLRTYPLAVLGLVLAFPTSAPAAAAWAVLAFGDAAASLVGRRVRAPSVFGHPKATWSGTLALAAVGFAAAYFVSAFVERTGGGAAPPVRWLAAAAVAAAAADLVPIPPDDNLPIAWSAGLVIAAGTGLLAGVPG